MEITQSMEDYLEDILKLSKVRPVVRSIDIATDMNYSKPSISVAMRHLRENGLINIDDSGFITLTDAGMKIAADIYDRHELMRKWLIYLGVDEQVAANDACKIEHALSAESYAALKEFVNKTMTDLDPE
ncbi:MAG: metal-dependent transcriptional regulator [Lachnospiraceae bacterium]|nr:metal-dependent transcriptional regulator [Lachnospiraceae bacterium]